MPRLLLLLLLVLTVAGCKPPTAAQRAYATSISPAGGPTTASMQIATDWRAQRLKLDECIDLAFQLIDGVKAGTPVHKVIPKSADATAFAGAVLDATLLLEKELPHGPEAEIFWMRMGGLAFAAAEEARAAGRGPEALALVMGGSRRWQSDAYWHMHPSHDGLASWLLAEGGNRAEALGRLQRRANLDGFALETYKKLGGS